MNSKEATKRKDLVTNFRAPQAVDRLINAGILKELDNDKNLAPSALGVEFSEDSDSVVRAKLSLEFVLQALQNLYDVTPEGKQISRNEIQIEVNKTRGETASEVIQRGLYFLQEFPALTSYGPAPGPVRHPVFNLEWLQISEQIVTIDVNNAWHEHIQNRRRRSESISSTVEMTTPADSGLSNESDDRTFARLAIDEARKSVPENDGRPHPWVGAVVVKDGKVLGTAHRGEVRGNHAEFVALERNLSDVAVAGATVYTTLEPCTTRNPPKIPCVDRLIARRVARVVIGILDPDERIRGKGQRKLSNAGIATSLFPHDLAMEVEELNREFTQFCEQHTLNPSLPTTDEDQSSWPDVILECQWPSLVHEAKIPGSHTVRKRPWILRYRGPGAVYNVRVHDIDFGAYKASFPFPVPTLTDTASVHPIICRKSDGLVITTHDLESLIQNPPSGCDVQQYAVEIDGAEGEEIQLGDFILEVEISVTISYDDKNGNQFKIKYLLRYDTYMEKGEMMRLGRIEKVTPK